jgi:BirA family biotin operon repressor/biotin-[acetyl-CoA-carboxylase] ligase
VAGVAVADVVGERAELKWPNDVLVDGRKVAGILVEGRPQEGWAVAGIGLNVAVRNSDFPDELRGRAGTMGLDPAAIEPTLKRLLRCLERWLVADPGSVLEAVRARDALRDKQIHWTGGQGRAAGVDDQGRLLVRCADGRTLSLQAGEVHLQT